MIRILACALTLALAPLYGCEDHSDFMQHVWEDVTVGDLYGPKSEKIDSWYAVEFIDAETLIINEPSSPEYNSAFLIIGRDAAIMLDAGSGQRPPGTPSMREIAQTYTDKPLHLVLTHFHPDHIGDEDDFDGVLMIDYPYLRARAENGALKATFLEQLISPLQTHRVERWVKDGQIIDLGDRQIQIVAMPGHTRESIGLVDKQRKYAFTGDFLYRHAVGLSAFFDGSSIADYKATSTRLVEETDDDYRFFGSHGVPEFNRGWLLQLDERLSGIVSGELKWRYVILPILPILPLRVVGDDALAIYVTPLVSPDAFFSWPTLIVFLALVATILFLLFLLCRLLWMRLSRAK